MKQKELELEKNQDQEINLIDITENLENENIFIEPEQEQEPEKKTLKKERKKRTGRRNDEPLKNPVIQEDEPEKIFDDSDLIDNIEEDEKSTVNLDDVFPTKTLVNTVDKLMSVLMPLLINTVANTKLKPNDFKLTASEKSTIEIPLKDCAKSIKIDFSNKWVLLGITAIGIYSAKVIEAVALNDNFEKQETRGRKKGIPNKAKD